MPPLSIGSRRPLPRRADGGCGPVLPANHRLSGYHYKMLVLLMGATSSIWRFWFLGHEQVGFAGFAPVDSSVYGGFPCTVTHRRGMARRRSGAAGSWLGDGLEDAREECGLFPSASTLRDMLVVRANDRSVQISEK